MLHWEEPLVKPQSGITADVGIGNPIGEKWRHRNR